MFRDLVRNYAITCIFSSCEVLHLPFSPETAGVSTAVGRSEDDGMRMSLWYAGIRHVTVDNGSLHLARRQRNSKRARLDDP
jgi:hypothetical protein